MLEIFDSTCILLSKAQHKHEKHTKDLFKKKGYNLNSVQNLVLYALYKGDGINLSELGEKCYLTNSTLTSVIDKLEANGMIERRADSSDRRAYNIYLKDKAVEMKAEILETMDQIYELMTEGCSEEEIAVFRKVLMNIFEKL